ncbi:MAG: response regulator [bacterium]|nr:response regulator [bacterium]
MDDKERIRELEQEVEHLKREKYGILDAINMAANISNFRSSLNKIDDPLFIVRQTAERIRRLIDFKSLAFYLVSEADSDFHRVHTEPEADGDFIETEVAALVEDKTFAWALQRNKPVIVTSLDKKEKIILHSMNTSSRTRGIFIGILDTSTDDLLDLWLFLFSITIIACSNGLESFELYKRIKDKNKALKENLHRLETSQRQLKEEEGKYRGLFEQSTNCIILYDIESRLPVEFNDQANTRLGYSREEFAKTKLEDYTVASLEEVKKRIDGIIARGHASYESKHRRKNGKLRYITVNARPVTIGGQTYLLTLFNDITDRKRAEEERMRLEKQLRQSQKMESIGTLAGGIAHDFNNILGVVQGYGELSLLDLPLTRDTTRNNIHSLLKAVDRAKDLVHQILTFSRRGEEDPGPMKINLVVKEILKLLRATLPSTIDVRIDIPGTSRQIMGIPTHIHQVVMNLCTNALHSMKDKCGTLDIQLSSIDVDAAFIEKNCPTTSGSVSRNTPSASVAGQSTGTGTPSHGDEIPSAGGAPANSDPLYKELKPGPYEQLKVTDTGHGIEPALVERIFDPYFTTKEPGEGTGLGLSVVHGIVKQYGGHIAIESEPEKGTTIYVRFPAVESPQDDHGETLENLPTGSENILLVDDEKGLLDSRSRILEKLGYSVTCCSKSAEAFELFRINPWRFQLVITDMTMPGKTGLQLAEEMLAVAPGFPIILCTGFSEYIDVQKAKNRGVSECLMKPINKNTLAKVIHRVLEQENPAGTP